VRAQGYHVVREAPDPATRRAHPRVARLAWGSGGCKAARTRMDAPLARELANVQHAAEENLRLQNLWDGIEVYAAILARFGAEKGRWTSGAERSSSGSRSRAVGGRTGSCRGARG
jgi:hypothetical protein